MGQSNNSSFNKRRFSLSKNKLLSANVFVVVALALIFLPMGKIRIGGMDAKPDFSTASWFAMLFAAGMGIGLMFWAVAEPVAYFTDWYGTPLGVEPNTQEGARLAPVPFSRRGLTVTVSRRRGVLGRRSAIRPDGNDGGHHER